MLWVLVILQQITFPQGVDARTYPKVYQCKIKTLVQVYDADTITKPDCDLGMGVTMRIQKGLRLYGINALEVRGEGKDAGQACRDQLRQVLKENDMRFDFMAVTNKNGEEVKGKYGRPVGHMFVNGMNMSLWAIHNGCAVQHDYD